MKKTVKLIVSGDGGVGKTSFLKRLIHDNFDNDSGLTKGVDFFSKILTLNGHEYNFVMWDFAGQNQFKQLLTNFVDGSIAAFVLFDLSRIKTIENVEKWINKLKEFIFSDKIGSKYKKAIKNAIPIKSPPIIS